MTATQHPLTETAAAEIPDEVVEKALNVWFFHAEGAPFGELGGYPSQSVRGMRAALSAALAVAHPAEPLARTILGVPEGPTARDAVRNVEREKVTA